MTRERLRNAYGQFLTIRRVETFDEQNYDKNAKSKNISCWQIGEKSSLAGTRDAAEVPLTAVSLPGFEIDNGPPIGSFGLTPFAVAGCPRSLARPAEAMKRRWRLLCPSEKDLHHENIERMIGN